MQMTRVVRLGSLKSSAGIVDHPIAVGIFLDDQEGFVGIFGSGAV